MRAFAGRCHGVRVVDIEGSVPGSEGRIKRKKTQEEKDAFLNARMGLKIENTKGAVVTKTVARDFFGREIKATRPVSEKPGSPLPTANLCSWTLLRRPAALACC